MAEFVSNLKMNQSRLYKTVIKPMSFSRYNILDTTKIKVALTNKSQEKNLKAEPD